MKPGGRACKGQQSSQQHRDKASRLLSLHRSLLLQPASEGGSGAIDVSGIYFLINKARFGGDDEREKPTAALCTKGIDIKTKVNVSILETAAGVADVKLAATGAGRGHLPSSTYPEFPGRGHKRNGFRLLGAFCHSSFR